MKKWILIFAAITLQLSLSARTIYVTRHGQVGYPMKEIRETRLTELGVSQAQSLANYLVKDLKFKGNIYVSPFYRTIETASFTGKLLDQKLILEPGIQEVATYPVPTPPGMSFAKIESYFPGLTVPGKRFVDQWRLCNESHLERNKRVAKVLDIILAEDKGDILFVGHGASVVSLVQALNRKIVLREVRKIKGIAWNCALYIFELNDQDQVTGGKYTTSYMADRDITNNFRCPLIERPDDSRYMTRAQDKADRAKKAKASQGKTSGKTTKKNGTANTQKNEVK